MKTTRPQSVNRKQVEQFLASAQNKAVAARKNLVIDAETHTRGERRTRSLMLDRHVEPLVMDSEISGLKDLRG